MTMRPRRAHQARRVRDLLRGAILAGSFSRGPLPGEHELATHYSTGRNVIRGALDLLRQEGLVVRIQGSGTFSLARKAYHRFDALHSLEESLGGRVARDVLVVEELPAPPAVAARLGLEIGDPCVFLERLTYVDGFPVSINGSYLRPDLVPNLDVADLAGDFYSLIHAPEGKEFGAARIVIESIPADPGVAELLRVLPGAPVLLIDRLLHLDDGTPCEWGINHSSTDRLALLLVTNRDQPGGTP